MKKKDRELLDEIKTKLDTVSENEKLPEGLSSESIVSLVSGQEQKKRTNMSHKQKKTTALATIAAVFVLCVCVFFAHRASRNPAEIVPTPKTTQSQDSPYGDAPLYTAANYEVIEQRFVKVARNYAKEAKAMEEKDYAVVNEAAATDKASAVPTEQASAAPADGASGAENYGEKDSAYSKTNVQVDGVDEADIVKTDGRYIYTVTGDFEYIKNGSGEAVREANYGTVKIVDIKNPDGMQIVSSVMPKIKNKRFEVRELYVSGNNLIVICNEWDYNGETAVAKSYYGVGFWGNTEDTLVVVYDITDRADPKEKGRYEQNGYYLSSRLIGNRVYVFSNYDVNVYQDEEQVKKDCVPQFGANGKKSRIAAEDISVMRSTDRTGYLVIGSVNFYGEDLSPTAKAVLGGGDESYCTKDTLYISNSVYDYELYTDKQLSDEEISVDMGRTEIFAFLLNEGRIEYKNYGTVSGIVDDQFSMDEYNGYFRIATTVGWNGYSIVTVLDKNLKRVGELTKIAEGETIYSVRFIGDTAYVVTYENTDPLHVIDLSDPKHPKILGQLEVPGFSSYMHPVGDKFILGIGEERNEEGELEKENTKLSVFDISDPMNPVEVSKEVLDGYSAARDNHKVFTVLPDGSFMIPINMYYYDGEEQDVMRAVRFWVDSDGNIVLGKSYYSEHISDKYEDPNSEPVPEVYAEGEEVDYSYEPNYLTYYNEIRRIVYADSVVYNIGELYIESFDLESAEKTGEVQIMDSQKLYDRDTSYYYEPVYNGAEVTDAVTDYEENPAEPVSEDTEEITSLAETATAAVTG